MIETRRPTDVFTFSAGKGPKITFNFSAPFPNSSSNCTAYISSSRGIKRPRPLADVEGDDFEVTRRKKRRLRLVLITSRLSAPFSFPPTHIIDRGSSKIAVWAKQKSIGRGLLRKAAILNRAKHQAIEARRLEQKHLELARQVFMRHSCVSAQIPRRQYIPLPPSPLGLSNYDALDAEDDLLDDDDDSGDECPGLSDRYTALDPAEPLTADYDCLDEIQPPPTKHPFSPPDRDILDVIKHAERQRAHVPLAIR